MNTEARKLTADELEGIEKRALDRINADPTNLDALDVLRMVAAQKAAIEDLEDLEALAEGKATPRRDFMPDELVGRILAGESPLKIWRIHRGMNQAALAANAGVTQAYLSELETGKKHGTVDVYKRLAEALDVTIDDLVR